MLVLEEKIRQSPHNLVKAFTFWGVKIKFFLVEVLLIEFAPKVRQSPRNLVKAFSLFWGEGGGCFKIKAFFGSGLRLSFSFFGQELRLSFVFLVKKIKAFFWMKEISRWLWALCICTWELSMESSEPTSNRAQVIWTLWFGPFQMRRLAIIYLDLYPI